MVPLLALAMATPASATGSGAGSGAGAAQAPTAATLAAVRAQAAAVQAELSAGARILDAARANQAALEAKAAAARSAAAKLERRLAVLRGEVSTYAGDIYVHPTSHVAMTAITSGRDISRALQAVDLLRMVNRDRTAALHGVVILGQQAKVLQARAGQAAAAAAVVKRSVAVQVVALQIKSTKAAARLVAAQAAYQAEQERLAAARIAAAAAAMRAARDRAARAAAARLASALRAQQAQRAQQVASPGECAAASSGSYPAGPWGGFTNGLIPGSQLCAIVGGGRLRPDAAVAFNAMSLAYAQSFGSPMCISDSYRSYGEQIAVFRERPSLAAVPGTSNHGWGLAVDLGCGVQNFGSAQYRWLTANAGRFGWVHPRWAVRRPFEPWHWEFGHLSGTGGT